MNNRVFFKALRETMSVDDAVLFIIKKEYGNVETLADKIGVSHQGVYGALKGQHPNVKTKIADQLGFNPWG